MLQFVLGRAGSGKTQHLRELLAEQSKTVQGGKRLVMLVPEQYSFETEKAMLALCGQKRANRIEVYSFTRLADAVFRVEGGAAGRRLSDGGRRVLMSCALSACEDQLEVYQNAVKSGRLTDLMLTAVNEMKLCGITPQQLFETARELHGKGLAQKLSEIALLYETYDALVAASYLDSRDDLTRLALTLQESEFFRNATVAVDSFDGFTAQELAVLTQIMRKAESVTVSLCTDGVNPTDQSGLFALVNRTRSRVVRAAAEQNVLIKPDVLLTGAPRFRNENLKLVEEQLFCADEPESSDNCEGITLFEARDTYEEAEYTAAQLQRLVREKQLRYRDFSIICRSPENYYLSLATALKKRNIPCFVSQPIQVDAEPVARFVLSAFAVVQGGFQTDDLLELLKTGVSGFTAEEISELENYAYLWRINGAQWREDWVRHPRGFGQEETEDDRAELAHLNDLRRRAILPLSHFAENTKDHTGQEISEAVFALLTEYSMEETLPRYCADLERAGDSALAARQVRVWELLMELLDQFYTILGDRKVTRDRYYFLLREVLAAEDISEIPQTVDEVLFGTPEQVRQSSPKVVFLLGASQGGFPLTPRSSGVFSDTERKELLEHDLPLGDDLEHKAIEERFLAYSVACAASEELYVSWARTTGGEDKEPGEIVTALKSIFPTLSVQKNLDDAFFCGTREAAFSRMAARFTENTPEAAALRELFADCEEYTGRIAALERAVGQKPAKIEDKDLAAAVFGERLFLSPTQIETYHSCPFQYFCRYGLNAKERRPAEVDVMQYGTLMHYLFEQVFGTERTESDWEEEKLLSDVQKMIADYAKENMGGLSMLSKREQYRLERLAQSAVKLLRHVREELAQSKFTPEHFELHLGDDPQLPPLKIPDGVGGVVTVGGTIDRADIYVDSDGREFVRVIDYKTGRKQFNLADVLYGLNMQMLVYLAALVENGRRYPAGILYVPAAEPSVTADRGTDDTKLRREADRQMRMNGLILSDDEIIRAMEAGAGGKYIPASFKKDGTLGRGSSVLDPEDYRQVLEHSKRLIATMGRKLKEGIVAAKPTMVNRNACKFCPYRAVCGKEFDDRDVVMDKSTYDEVLEKMKGGTGNEMD